MQWGKEEKSRLRIFHLFIYLFIYLLDNIYLDDHLGLLNKRILTVQTPQYESLTFLRRFCMFSLRLLPVLDERTVVFTLKARPQVLPTKLSLSIWLPDSCSRHCAHHGDAKTTENLSLILNGCHACKGLYICRHDRIVDLISIATSSTLFCIPVPTLYYKAQHVPFFHFLCNNASDVFCHVWANATDAVVIYSTFDHSLEGAFLT